MSSNDDPRQSAGGEPEGGNRVETARAMLAAIDAKVFPGTKEIPFYEQSVLIRRAVTRLFGDG